MKAYVLINTRTGGVREVVRDLHRVEGILDAHMTFGPYDVVAILEAADINRIGYILATRIQPIPGVVQTLTCLAVEDQG